MDEATFLSPAYSLATKGILSTDVHASFLPGTVRFTYWMPPLYMVLLGGVMKIFGTSLLTAKLFSLILTIAAAVSVIFFTKDKYLKYIAAALLLICPFVIVSAARIRMEPLAVLLICLAIVAVRLQWSAFIAGVVAGLAFMTHPMTLGCCAGLAYFNYRRGSLGFFLLAAVIVMLPYLVYIAQDFDLFKEQMGVQYIRKASASISKLKLEYILQFVPVSLAAIALIYLTKGMRDIKGFLFISLTITMALTLKSNEFNYQVYSIPYVIAALVLFLEGKGSTPRIVLPALLFMFFVGLLALKERKNNSFQDDSTYYEIERFLSENKNDWNGRNIYVTGPYDVSSYFIANEQNVERINVGNRSTDGWHNKFDYVVVVMENKDKTKRVDKLQFWQGWDRRSFTTSDGIYTIELNKKTASR